MDKKKMTVAEILAAARKADGGGGQSGSAAESKPAPAEASAPSAPDKPAAKPAAEAKPKPAAAAGARPSVADILAAARAEKGGALAQAPAEAKPAAVAAKPAAPKPAAKPAAEKASPKAPAAAVPVGPKDTGSILAEARKDAKPGPMTKAEAAAKAPAKPAAKEVARRAAPPMPVKPDYAKPKPPKPVADQGRRTVMLSLILGSSLATGFTALATTFGLWTLGFARFMFPNVLTEPPSRFKVGFPGNFAPGQVETKFVAQYGVWVVNWEYNGQQQIYALRTVCTHLGCTPNWLEAEQKFKCPCHGSGFYKDGINFEGPAPRPLERYAISLADDGQIEIDKSRLFQEEFGQWADPSSFVAV